MHASGLLILALIVPVGSCYFAQSRRVVDCTAPGSDSALLDSARIRIARGLPSSDFGGLFVGEGGHLATFRLEVTNSIYPEDSVALHIRDIALLAWHTKRIGPLLERRSALLWSRYLNRDSTEGWALLVLCSGVEEPEWTAPQRKDQPLMRFSHAPTNEDVRAFLDQLQGIEGRVLGYDTEGVYDWEGVAVTFVGGEVCAETWEEVIGEKPLPLFPKGK